MQRFGDWVGIRHIVFIVFDAFIGNLQVFLFNIYTGDFASENICTAFEVDHVLSKPILEDLMLVLMDHFVCEIEEILVLVKVVDIDYN